jgi:hypothetical protein
VPYGWYLEAPSHRGQAAWTMHACILHSINSRLRTCTILRRSSGTSIHLSSNFLPLACTSTVVPLALEAAEKLIPPRGSAEPIETLDQPHKHITGDLPPNSSSLLFIYKTNLNFLFCLSHFQPRHLYFVPLHCAFPNISNLQGSCICTVIYQSFSARAPAIRLD